MPTRAILVASLLCFASLAAAQGGVFKYRDAKGRTVYTDDPAAGNGNAVKIDIPPPPPAEAAPAGLQPSEAEKKMLEEATQRSAALDRATEAIVTSFNRLREAEVKRDQGEEPVEGERQGRILRAEYWQRQKALENNVDAARRQLDQAIERRNALR